MDSREKLFTPQEIANLGLLSLVAQWQLRKTGKLSHYRLGRKILYSQQHLDSYLASCECQSTIVSPELNGPEVKG